MSDDKSTGFDLSQVENDDEEALANKIEGYYKKDSTAKTQLSYHWERNAMMLDGKQWLVFDGDEATGGLWKKLTVSRANEYIPRPVTNYLFDGYQTLKSYVIKNKPRTSVKPNTQTFKDKSAAKIAELVCETNWERLKEEANYEYAASCLVTYGTVFKKDYWDTTTQMTVKVPKMQPGAVDPATGQPGPEVPAVDPLTGEEMFDELPLGDVNTDVVEPYRIAIDPMANDIHKIRWIMEYAIQPLEWIKETYGKEGEGYTGRVDEVKEESNLSGSMSRFYKLKNSSGTKSRLDGGSAGGDNEESLSNSAVVKEYYERPSTKHPKGRLVVVANKITLYAGDSPYEGPELGDWHPYSECRWEIMSSRFWGKSPLDAACEVQKQVNSIDSVIILTRKTMAIPQKLIPLGAGITKGTWTGRPGQEIEYRDSGGPPPSVIPSSGVDATVFQERGQRVDDIKNLMGSIDILKGDRPPGVNAASALELLYEVGTGKLFPVLDRWKKLVESSQKKQLRCVSKFYKEPRPQFIAMLKMRNTRLSEDAINKFIGTDLYDNCNVIVEAGSNVPKLESAKKSRLQEAAQAGTLALEDPTNRAEYNRQMGISGFDTDVAPDIERAEWENDLLDNIEASPDNKPIVLQVDNDEIHMAVLANRMKEPVFHDLSSAVQQAYMAHYTEHMTAKSNKDQQAAQEAMMTGKPPAPPAPAGQGVGKAAGKGPSTAAKSAMDSDMKIPGGGK